MGDRGPKFEAQADGGRWKVRNAGDEMGGKEERRQATWQHHHCLVLLWMGGVLSRPAIFVGADPFNRSALELIRDIGPVTTSNKTSKASHGNWDFRERELHSRRRYFNIQSLHATFLGTMRHYYTIPWNFGTFWYILGGVKQSLNQPRCVGNALSACGVKSHISIRMTNFKYTKPRQLSSPRDLPPGVVALRGHGMLTAGDLERAPSASFSTAPSCEPPLCVLLDLRRRRRRGQGASQKDKIEVQAVYSAAGYWFADGYAPANFQLAPVSASSTPYSSPYPTSAPHSSFVVVKAVLDLFLVGSAPRPEAGPRQPALRFSPHPHEHRERAVVFYIAALRGSPRRLGSKRSRMGRMA
ncbi:hypothetical protein DFH06DRAFT_1307960 [Mycena polygramma]|nr:hypothetical protein DFH06DRAFT_1307960 [Mycena polygramma]